MATFMWDARELLILEAVNDGYERGDLVQNSTALAEIIGRSVDETRRTVKALYEADYLNGAPSEPLGGGGRIMFDLIVMRPTERARREIGQWPSVNPYDDLVALLERRITETADPDQRSRLEKFRDGLLSMGREIGTSLLIALVKGQTGLP